MFDDHFCVSKNAEVVYVFGGEDFKAFFEWQVFKENLDETIVTPRCDKRHEEGGVTLNVQKISHVIDYFAVDQDVD